MARLGLLVPSANTVVEPEFWRLAPAGVTFHAARMRNSGCDAVDARKMLDHVNRAADELGSARVDAIAFACTASSFVSGSAGEADLRGAIEHSSGAPAVTTSGAVVAALNTLGARSLAMYTPYPAELNALEVDFLAQHGIAVEQDRGMDIREAVYIADVQPDELVEFVRTSPPPQSAEAIFLSCTNLPTLDVIEPLEALFGRPVISSNTATLRALLQMVDAQAPAPGRLFEAEAYGAAA